MPQPNSKRSRRLKEKYDRKRATQLEILSRIENKPLDELVILPDNHDRPTSRYLCILNAGRTGNVGGVSFEDLESSLQPLPGFIRLDMLLGK
ncbi:hypothetical protein HK097_005121, partial [Rhizophlyctis rosea]